MTKLIVYVVLISLGCIVIYQNFRVIHRRVKDQVKLKSEAQFSGHWVEKKGNSEVFTLDLKQVDDSIFGSICSVMESGNKIDCDDNKTDSSIVGKITNLDTALVHFISSWEGAKGEAIIVLKNNMLYWTIVKYPKGLYFIPDKRILHR